MAKLYFYYASMNAGKSSTLLQTAFNYDERGMRVSLWTAALDDRPGFGAISSRIGLASDANRFEAATDIAAHVLAEHGVTPLACVLVDEAQFLTREQVWQLARLADEAGIPVICYGLRTDFQGELFPGSAVLLGIADALAEMKAVCDCGRKATMNLRVDAQGAAVLEGAQTEIGGNDRYVALCRRHFVEKLGGRHFRSRPANRDAGALQTHYLFGMTETLLLAAILIPCLIVAIVFHEVAHGWTALALGDTTARDEGRLTLNPIRHVDPVGTLLVPGALALFGGPVFGWAKPVPVVASRLRNPRFGMMAVAAAGPGTNIVLAFLGALLVGIAAGLAANWGTQLPEWAMTAFGAFILINAFLAFFNLLPIPPFDGSHIVGGLLPRSWARQWQHLQALGMLMLFVLIAATWAFPDARWIENTVLPPVEWMSGLFYAVANGIAGFIA